jgi:hypothetical protein
MSSSSDEDDAVVGAFYREMSHEDLRTHGAAWHAERDRRLRELMEVTHPRGPDEPDAPRLGRPPKRRGSEFPAGAPAGALDGGGQP